jgi:acetyl esterase/lipase
MKRESRLMSLALAAFAALFALPAAGQTQPADPPKGTRAPGQGSGPLGAHALRNLEYARVDGRPLALDLYWLDKPGGAANAAGGRPLPLIVWIHGGGWESGDKNNCPALFMVPKGFAAASIQYRLTDTACFPAQIHDCKGAIRWLRANAGKYNIDPNRIGVWGSSAGGHLAALLGVSANVKELEGTVGGNLQYSSRVQAVCDFFGPADLMPLTAAGVSSGALGPVSKLLGGPPADKKDLAALASPVTHASKNAPPFLIMHGDRDTLVPLSQSQALQDALKKAGADSTLVVAKGAGHGFGGPQISATVEAFFAKHLLAAAAASGPAPAAAPSPAGPASRPAER